MAHTILAPVSTSEAWCYAGAPLGYAFRNSTEGDAAAGGIRCSAFVDDPTS